jgi:hypothetical protein
MDIEQARLEQHLAELTDAEFDALVARTRPPATRDVKELLHREMRRNNMPLTSDFKQWETR